KQVVDRGYSVASVATRLDITTHSLYGWIKKYVPDSSTTKEQSDAQAEIRRLQKELKRVTDERDIFKKAAVDSICQRKIHLDLRDSVQQCGVNRVWRLMKRVGIKTQVGYRSPRARKGEASIVSPNRLQRQ
ncbi:transposase, partial [Lelliottia amnigena]|uniref:transposase n=1 Tax=Lelliottia amnigena TaxID=61646 RepID=UPI004055EA4D